MAQQWHVGDRSSQAWRISIDDIDEWGLLGQQPNQTEDEPMDEGTGEEDRIYAEDNVEEGNSDEIYVGRVFTNEDEAYEAYNTYALTTGFGVRKGKTTKSRTDGKIIRRQYVCNKEGLKKRDKRLEGRDVQFPRDSRCDCPAKMEVILNDLAEWVLVKLVAEHNHPLLATPSKSRMLRSHATAHRSHVVRSLVTRLNSEGIGPSNIARVCNAAGAWSEQNITARQCGEIVRSDRRNNVGRECLGIIKYFKQREEDDGSFFFTMDVGDDGALRSVFWADGRARTAFHQFCDVLVFDVTYRTNKFKMSFAPFTGVNHHMQSILFGGALLEDETTETFVWLFSQFRRCMFDRPPTAIITDQDAAICKAVALVFPESRHRYCLWHVRKHEIEHLQGYRSRYPNFDQIYQRWVRSDTPAEFEAGWQNMSMQFDVEPRCWLRTMYEKRHHWIKCYLNDTFWAGMTTTGRSESINAYFDGYVNANTMLNEFVVQYDKAVQTRRESEEREDFQTMNTQATLSGRHPIEKAAGDRYTRRVFRKFQAEFIASNNYTHANLNKDGCSGWYRVGHVDEDQRRCKVMQYTTYDDPFVRCSCALFETAGILCQHALYIMRKKKVVVLPEQFILSRWTLSVRYRIGQSSAGASQSTEQASVPATLDLWNLRAKLGKVYEDAKEDPDDVTTVSSFCDQFLEKASLRRYSQTSMESTNYAPRRSTEWISELDVSDPVGPVRTKGRPRIATRIRSGIETSNEIRGKRSCGYCGEQGHISTGCGKRKLSAQSLRDEQD